MNIESEEADIEATEFARELLMPAKLFRASAKALQAKREGGKGRGFTDADVVALSKEYQVPQTEVVLRLVALGLVRPIKVQRG